MTPRRLPTPVEEFITAARPVKDDIPCWQPQHSPSKWDGDRLPGEDDRKKKARIWEARRLCMTCPVRAECLDLHYYYVAIEQRDHHGALGRQPGVWGGQFFPDRADDPNTRKPKPLCLPLEEAV